MAEKQTNQNTDKIQEEAISKAMNAFDSVVDLVIYMISWIVAIFLPVSLGTSQGLAGFFAKNKYEIVKVVALVVLSAVIMATVLFNAFNTKIENSSSVDLGAVATDISGVKAVVLNVPYFNQLLEKDGKQGPLTTVGGGFPLGGVICGAASSTMVAGYYKKMDFGENELDLKPYSYQDKGLGLPSKCSHLGIGGAFGMTAYDSLCNQSGVGGIQAYFSQLNIPSSTGWGSPSFELVKNAIDSGKPVIVSLTTFEGYGHLAVIKGYTEDGRFVMNDPWTDVQSGNRSYSFKGKNALYQADLGSQGDFKYYLIIG